jgi:hypothetical protein
MRSLPLSALVELARYDFVHDPAARAFLLAVGSSRGRARARRSHSERPRRLVLVWCGSRGLSYDARRR